MVAVGLLSSVRRTCDVLPSECRADKLFARHAFARHIIRRGVQSGVGCDFIQFLFFIFFVIISLLTVISPVVWVFSIGPEQVVSRRKFLIRFPPHGCLPTWIARVLQYWPPPPPDGLRIVRNPYTCVLCIHNDTNGRKGTTFLCLPGGADRQTYFFISPVWTEIISRRFGFEQRPRGTYHTDRCARRASKDVHIL